MKVFSIDSIDAERSTAAALSPGGYTIARLETEGGDRLKLVAPHVCPARSEQRDFVLARCGFAYLTFIVPDILEMLSKLKEAGATIFTGESPVAFRHGVVDLFFAKDPEGNFLEFVERTDLASYRAS